METFLLSIQLYMGAPVLTYRVPSCEVGEAWLASAWKWAQRSHVKLEGVVFVCGRVET